MVERTGTGDPLRLLPLLWGRDAKAGRRGLTLDGILDAAVALADQAGLQHVTMRRLADELGVGTMTLYGHVPGRAELIDLLVDQVHKKVRYDEPTPTDGWRERVARVAAANWSLFGAHPWLLDIDATRPPLGPGTIAKYDAELGSLDGTGLDDVQIDQALTLVLEHVRATARQRWAQDRPADARSGDVEWWASAGPVLATLMDPTRYPRASRIGQTAGEAYQAPTNPDLAYEFGLTTILDGLHALIHPGRPDHRSP